VSEQRFRLPGGGRINRDRPLDFQFNGTTYTGFAGDTLASALLANGVHFVARSFKYHRPRGVLSAGPEEPNALVQLEDGARTRANVRATEIELYAGLSARSENCWPSLNFDVAAINGRFARLMPAGFYYKTFMWPPSWWLGYERVIRNAAGIGHAPDRPDPDRYDKLFAHCDVMVVGAGPAGLAAALAAGRAGARVLLADEQSEPGGSLLARKSLIDDRPALDWVAEAIAELTRMPEVRILTRSTVYGYFDHNFLAIAEHLTDSLGQTADSRRPRERLWKVRAKQVVLATGAQERPLVFRNNDRPGIMLASAVQAYVNRYAVRAGDSAVVFTNNDSAYATALDLSDAGLGCTVVDARATPPDDLRTLLRKRGVEVLAGHGVVTAHGGRRVRGVEVRPLTPRCDAWRGTTRHIDCDVVALSGGWSPVVHLCSQSRGRLAWDAAKLCFVPGESVQAERSAGACNGALELAYCLSEGREAGKSAAADAGFRKRGGGSLPRVETRVETPILGLWTVPPAAPDGSMDKHFVDIHNDVSVADIRLAAREGYRSVEHLKRYTTTGMGTDQGKTSNINALAVLAEANGMDIPAVGTTTFRPPYTPVSFGMLAGRDIGALMDPARRTPMHEWHVVNGAVFEDVGQWKRPWYFPHRDESMHDAVNRECLATRNAIGILDATTLGKIDIHGPDAGEFLNRIYTNAWKKLAPGRCRYGLMCGEDGMVFDDGVSTRVSENHYLMSTTTGNAARVLGWLEMWLQTEWPELRVYCNSYTEQYAVAAISGPLARRLLAELTTDIDLGADAFPFMSMREGHVAQIPARVTRVSFTGELSFEISVAAHYGMALWTTLMRAGEKYGITPFGTETMHVLRAEKGFIICGQDTDGTVTPADLGMDWIVSRRKDFIGKRSFARADTARGDRKQLVGLLTEDPAEVLPEGAQIVDEVLTAPPMEMIGHVSSSYWSACLGHSIALALVKNGRARIGDIVKIPGDNKVVSARITEPRFYDPDGERMHG